MSELFALQDALSARLARALALPVSPRRRAAGRSGPGPGIPGYVPAARRGTLPPVRPRARPRERRRRQPPEHRRRRCRRARGAPDSRWPRRSSTVPRRPIAPEVIRRDAEGRATMRAIRLDAPLQLDGQLDERVYFTVPPVTDFIQQEPDEGEPARDQTEVWVLFDRDTFYVAARCWSTDPDRIIANEMKRDSYNMFGNETFSVVLGHLLRPPERLQLHHQRARGAVRRHHHQRADPQPGLERGVGRAGRPLRAGLDAGDGDSLQVAPLPDRSVADLGHQLPAQRGFHERNVLPDADPRRARIPGDVPLSRPRPPWWASRCRSPAPGSRSKPYAISDVTTDLNATPRLSNDPDGDFGVGRQVRRDAGADRRSHLQHRLRAGGGGRAAGQPDPLQPVLSREARVLPRGAGDLRLRRRVPRRAPPPTTSGASGFGGSAPVLFFSRRIGLNEGRTVPIRGGGRLTGKVGPYSIGLLDVQNRLGIGGRHGADELRGGPPEARRAAPERGPGRCSPDARSLSMRPAPAMPTGSTGSSPSTTT